MHGKMGPLTSCLQAHVWMCGVCPLTMECHNMNVSILRLFIGASLISRCMSVSILILCIPHQALVVHITSEALTHFKTYEILTNKLIMVKPTPPKLDMAGAL